MTNVDPRPPTSLVLSVDQREAIDAPAEGSLKIVAGAGSGKTEVLTRRIARLLSSGVEASELVALTYTNKAAGSMKERLIARAGLPPSVLRELTVSTFHSFLSGLIKADPFACGLDRGTTILTAGNRDLLLAGMVERFAEIHAGALFSGPDCLGGKMLKPLLQAFPQALGQIRRFLLSPGDFLRGVVSALERAQTPATDFQRRTADWLFRFYHFYLQTLGEKQLLDFDEILLRGRDLLSALAESGEHPRERVFLIDEFQDNNREQLGIIELFLTAGRGHLTVVGDPRQSIYRFQGADVATFNTFRAVREITLSENHRSYAEILHLADGYILAGNEPAVRAAGHQTACAGPSPRPHPVTILLDEIGGGAGQTSLPSPDPVFREADTIAEMIERMVRGNLHRSMPPKGGDRPLPLTWGDIAIIVASIRRLPRALEDALLARNIPYLLSGLGFYDRAEIKGIMAFLSLLANPQDDRALLTILSGPLYGIADAELAPLAMAGRKSGVSLFNHLLSLSPALLPDGARSFQRLFSRLQERQSRLRLLDLVYELLDEAGFREDVARQPHPLKKRRMENNLGKFVDIVRQFEAGGIFTTLRDFLAWYQEFESSGIEESEAGLGLEEGEAVRIMTVHKAKGLEFPVVFMPFLRSRPYRRRDQLVFSREYGLLVRKDEFGEASADRRLEAYDAEEASAAAAEERRKWYVGLTRAQELLIVSGRSVHAEKPGEPISELAGIVRATPGLGRVLPMSEATPAVASWLALEAAPQANVDDSLPPVPPGEHPPATAASAGLELQIRALTDFRRLPAATGTPAATHEEVFSLTDLQIFERCPRRYFYTRQHLPAFVVPDDEAVSLDAWSGTHSGTHSGVPCETPPPAAREIGNLVHQVLRLYHAVPVAEISHDERRNRIDRHLSSLAGWYIRDEASSLERARAILAGYLDSPLASRDSWLQEAEVNLRFESPGGTFWVRGFADRVDRDGNDTIVVDYKTRPYSPAVHAAYARQMALYLTAAHRGILGDPGALNFPRIEIAYLTPQSTRVFPAHPDLQEFERWAVAIVGAIRKEQAWRIPPAVDCATCPFVILCGTSPANR